MIIVRSPPSPADYPQPALGSQRARLGSGRERREEIKTLDSRRRRPRELHRLHRWASSEQQRQLHAAKKMTHPTRTTTPAPVPKSVAAAYCTPLLHPCTHTLNTLACHIHHTLAFTPLHLRAHAERPCTLRVVVRGGRRRRKQGSTPLFEGRVPPPSPAHLPVLAPHPAPPSERMSSLCSCAPMYFYPS